MTDSMNFGPDWIRNLSSDGSTGNAGGVTGGGTRYQLAEYRYGREEMLALFDKNSKPPVNLTNFKCLYSEIGLLPLALLPTSEEERGWQGRVAALSGGPPARGGRGGSMERGGGRGRGRGGGVYQYGRTVPAYEGGGGGGWGNNGDQSDWSPRKEYNPRTMSLDNWRRSRNNEEDDGWRNVGQARTGVHDKWSRSTSWRGEGDSEERTGPPERGGRTSWGEQMNRGPPARRSWDNEDHLPEWATENPTEGGGSFDDKGAFHGSDDEQLEGRPPNRRETPALHKSTSQQHISSKSHHPPLASSKSTMSLVKSEDSTKRREGPPKIPDEDHTNEEIHMIVERKKSVPNIPEKIDKEVVFQERAKSEGPPKCKPNEKQPELIVNGPVQDRFRHEDSDFEKLQEDFVLKLVVDEELPKQTPNNFEIGNMPVPPNLVPQQIPDKWFYQDPQGQMQGPFTNLEMAEWYKAGYFSNQLKVRRHYDERFFLLGELISMCGGVNPFQAGVRFPTLKNDVTKMPEPDIAQFQYLSQLNAYKEAQARIVAEPWSALTLQQQETAAQRLIMQQQVPQDLQYIQQPAVANPLMHMINQMQQANKLPSQGLVDKQPPNMPGTIDPHLHMHMGNILSMQSRIPAGNLANNLPTGMTGNLTGSMPPENLSTSMPSLQSAAMNSSGMTLSSMQGNIPVSIGGSINMPRPTSHGSVDQVNSVQDNDPISSLLKQLQQQKQHMDWQQNQYGIPTSSAPPPQWQSQNEVPLTMWDLQQNNTEPASPAKIQPEPDESQQQQNGKVEKELRIKEETLAKELKRKKEQEEKQLKKEAEEKRKQEQRRIESEKRAAEEKKRKEEERVKKELEKVKKEAEEKRMRELEEKRKLKDQRKAEEEAKKRTEENRKTEEERIRQELKKAEAKRQAEDKRLQQEQIRIAKAAPWSQSNSTLGMSLTEIQKAEKERKAHETALQVQRLQEKEMHQQQQQEKNAGIHLNWAKKPVEPRKVKSLAEIQAEEQEQLAKQAAESRLQKEKEVVPVANNTSSIWNSQNLNWTNPSANNHQWSTTSGFWDDSSSKNVINKPSTVTKSNSTNTFNTSSTKQQQQTVQAQKHQPKSKTKKEEPPARSNHNNNNRPVTDDFTNWCYKTLSNISTNVDIPTFVTFLRDIESAFDVREYCKEYLGESNATHQFASNFLEKRRSFKPKNNAHKDDMCSPAPAITPSLQHSTEFQEVKGKKQKNKKSKMLKVDSRILGFNVTSAPDRINVGDRDYGDNS